MLVSNNFTTVIKVGHIGGQGELGELPSLAVGPAGEVLVADSKILVYSEEGVMVSNVVVSWNLDGSIQT